MWLIPASLTSRFSPELVVSISEFASQNPGAGAWVTLSGTATLRPFSWPGWKNRPWMLRRSGVATSPPSMRARFVAEWAASLEVTPVNPSARPASAAARTTSATSGRTFAASSSRRDRNGSSSRTSAGISRSASTLSIESYRSLVSRLRRDFNRRQKLAQAMAANGSSFWPTAQAHDAATPKTAEQIARMKATAPKRKGGGPPGVNNLNEVTAMWPTPSAALTNDGEEPQTFLARQERLKEKGINGNGAGIPLTIASKMWPTPEGIRDAKSPGTRALLARRQDESARGQPLMEVAAHWPTPTVGDAKSSGSRNTEDSNANFGVSLTDVALGSFGTGRSSRQDPQTTTPGAVSSQQDRTSLPRSLNPNFVEWLMGWPLGWTDSASREMEWSRYLQRQRTALSSLSWNFEPKPGAEPEPLQLELV